LLKRKIVLVLVEIAILFLLNILNQNVHNKKKIIQKMLQ